MFIKFILAISACFRLKLLVNTQHWDRFSVTVRFRSKSIAVSACYVKLSTKIRSNVLKAGYRMQDLFCDNNLWFRDFVITRNQVASHLVVIFWYVHVIYNFEYSSRDVFTVMFLLVATIFKLSEVRQCKFIPKAHQRK